jgi:hypothetical protein
VSKRGPSLIRRKDGGAAVKIAGRQLRLGRYDDPESHQRYHALMRAWVAAGRQLTDEVLLAAGKDPGRRRRRPQRAPVAPTRAEPEAASTVPPPTTPDHLTVGALCDRYVEHLREKHAGDEGWFERNGDAYACPCGQCANCSSASQRQRSARGSSSACARQ